MNKMAKFALSASTAWLLLLVYYIVFNNLKTEFPDVSLVSELNWKNGFFLNVSYTLSSILLLAFKLNSSLVRKFVFVLAGYIIIFGVIAFPYMLVSFLQPFRVNTFLHFLFLIICIELFIHGRYVIKNTTE